jgi:small subunit ribosomal protein S20
MSCGADSRQNQKRQKKDFAQMAIHKSAKKRIRRNARVGKQNKSRTSALRTSLRKVEDAIKSGDEKSAAEALKAAQPKLHRNASKGNMHKKTASRKLSRLSKRVKALKK